MTEVEKQSLSGQEIVHSARPTALVAGGRGVGDILRLTPLIRVFAQLGYEVDVLVAPDYPKTLELLEGAPEIRNLFYLRSSWRNLGGEKLEGLERNCYDIAAITFLATLTNDYQKLVRARRTIVMGRREWWREGDYGNAETIAREVGWEGQLPPPFAMASERKFNLPAGTVAMHPGCKPDWAWKKWHGFDELAEQFPSVAIIGMPDDLNNETTYFKRPFRWPAHVQDFIGLSLPDTAALLRECVAMISNDSGLMHLSVAMRTPTFGIFGLTSQQHEAMRTPNMFAITKQLPCEPRCRKRPLGRRDCEYHVECLKTLTAAEVQQKVVTILPSLNNPHER